jgi:hypothetical protein
MLCQGKSEAERSGCDLMTHGPICSRFKANLHGQDTRYSSVVILPRSTEQETC